MDVRDLHSLQNALTMSGHEVVWGRVDTCNSSVGKPKRKEAFGRIICEMIILKYILKLKT